MASPHSIRVRTGGTGLTELVILPTGIALDPQSIIKEIRSRPNVKSLNLGHSALGDEGSKVLFRWLAYGDDDGVYEDRESCLSLRLPHLNNLNLTACRLKNEGFSALVGWLERLKRSQQLNMCIPQSKNPDGIRVLSLQNNIIEGTSNLALLFVSALTFHKIEPPYISSSLVSLTLSSNPLSFEFKKALFSSLASLTSLRLLSLSFTGLNQTDADALAPYLGRCRLTDFKASANRMGYSGLKKILKAIKRCWTLERVDLYANDIDNRGDNEEDSSDDEEERAKDRVPFTKRNLERKFEDKLQGILLRNLHMKRIVRKEAFELLRCSRLLLLNRHPDLGRSHSELLAELVEQEAPHHYRCTQKNNCKCLPTFCDPPSRTPSPVPIDPPHASNSPFPFTRLPTEIQLTVLSQLAPMLSSSQQIQIFEHAVDKATLPDLSLHLPSFKGGCRMPTTGGRGGLARSTNSLRYSAQGSNSFEAAPHIMTQAQKWLELVGCDAYDPN